MKTFRSKLGREIIIPISVLLVGLGTLMVYNKLWPGFFIVLSVSLFIAHIFLTTYYQIDGKVLRIKCGFFCNMKVDIETIRRMSETNNPISSPANSIDRLELKFQKDKKIESVIISPKHKEEFIKMVTSINPKIEVILKSPGN
jgi:hypothetical protein